MHLYQDLNPHRNSFENPTSGKGTEEMKTIGQKGYEKSKQH